MGKMGWKIRDFINRKNKIGSGNPGGGNSRSYIMAMAYSGLRP